MVALKLDCFCTAEALRRRTDEGVRLIRGTPGAPGVNRGWLRAEKEAETERDRREHHVPLAEGTLEEIRELADDLGVSLAL